MFTLLLNARLRNEKNIKEEEGSQVQVRKHKNHYIVLVIFCNINWENLNGNNRN